MQRPVRRSSATSAGRGIPRSCGFAVNVRCPRMVYLDGTVWLMSPAFPHERLKKRLGWVVEVIVDELDIPCIAAGIDDLPPPDQAWRSRGGPDATTWLMKSVSAARTSISLKTDPPPDLAIEAVYSHDADAAIEVYRRFKVPEVWVCDEAELVILVLQSNGRYAESATSAAFPFLSAAEMYDWVSRPQTESDTEWIKELRQLGPANAQATRAPVKTQNPD